MPMKRSQKEIIIDLLRILESYGKIKATPLMIISRTNYPMLQNLLTSMITSQSYGSDVCN